MTEEFKSIDLHNKNKGLAINVYKDTFIVTRLTKNLGNQNN